MKRLEGGYLGGRPTWSLASNPGIWAMEQVFARRVAGTWPVGAGSFDEYYEYVTFMLHANGANASTSFPDSSLYGRAVTANGNAQVSTAQSKFGGASAYFDGNGDYLNLTNTPLRFGTSDFTLEFWCNIETNIGGAAGTNYPHILSTSRYTDSGGFYIYINGANTGWGGTGTLNFGSSTGSNGPSLSSTSVIRGAGWKHIAITRQGSTFRLFVDGAIESTQTAASANFTGVTGFLMVSTNGTGIETTLGANDKGYIDEFRITQGYARYTSNFSVPTGPYEDEGAPLVDPFINSVSLLLPMNGSNNSTTFTDRSPNALTVTANGDAKLSTAVKRYGVSSAVFDGTGDYLSVAHNAALSIESTDFTLEAWVYRSISGAAHDLLNKRADTPSASGWGWRINATNTLQFYHTGGSSVTSATTINSGVWTHVACVRSGNTVRQFINGTLDTTTATFSNGTANTQELRVGLDHTLSGGLAGYIDDLRITKGVARYVANFIPPLPHADYGTLADPYLGASTLWMPMEGPVNSTGFFDRADRLPVTTNGNAKISNAQYKWGLTSAYFDGAGDYLDLGNPSAVRLAANDFTFELWIYPTSSETEFVYWNADNSTAYAALRLNTTGGLLYVLLSTTGSSWAINSTAGTVALNRWSHVAISRSGTTLRAFINGVQTFSGSISGSLMTSGTANILGARTYSPSLTYFTGYMDDVRLLLGHGAYTTNFTTPTAPINADTSSDPYLSNVSLLLKMDGANNSTTFTDSSLTPKAVFANGDAKISTAQSKFGGSSALFDGTGDRLVVPSNADFNFGTGDFTIELWVYHVSFTADRFYVSAESSGGLFFGVGTGGATSNLYIGWGRAGIAWDGSALHGMSINTWNHVAVTRSGTNMRLFVNGSQIGSTVTNSTSYDLSTTALNVGSQGANYYLNAYIDDLRVTKGVARYTANFLPPTIGHPVWSETDANFSSVSLLLNGNGTNASTVIADRSSNGLTLVPNGNAQISTTQSRFGGSSLYFDGTGDYLSIPPVSAFGFGVSDFTIEAWIYVASLGTDRGIVDFRSSTTVEPGTFFIDGPTSKLAFWYGSKLGASGTTLAASTWYHVALTRSSGVFNCYLNGVLDFTATATVDFGATRPLGVGGCVVAGSLGTSPFNGYIDDLRITKGVARYTAAFTPPVAPHPIPVIDPNFGAVSLLLHMNGANASTTFPDHSYNALAVTANGNAQISTAQSKFGGSSALFDGNGDYLTLPDSDLWDFGTGNFTIELWVRLASIASVQTIATNYISASTGWGLQYRSDDAGFTFINGDTKLISRAYSTTDTWVHLCVTRSGTDLRMFFDGVQQGVAVTNSTNIAGSTDTLRIGRLGYFGQDQWFNGYIDDLRITKGIARYTANFTPPTTQFPNS